MTSKEALEQIKCDLISTQCELFKDNCYDERVLAVYQLDALQIIKQDLDRLEALEKNNQELNKIISGLLKSKKELNQENEKLKKFVSHFKRDIQEGLSGDYRHGENIIFDRLLNEFGKQFLKEVLGK